MPFILYKVELIDEQGHAMLTDFGLALLTEIGTRGEIFGSPYYIAPEQAISSAGAVPQSDLYAVGVVLYEILTGEVPFDAEDPLDIAAMHLTEEPPSPREIRPEISPALEAMMLKALAKEPGDRFPNGAALAASLDEAVKKSSADVPPPSSPTVSHPTIPNRVASEVAARPLPPIPAAVAVPPPRRAEPRTIKAIPPISESPGKRRSLLTFVRPGLGLILLVLLIGVLLSRLTGKQREEITPASVPTAEATLADVGILTTVTRLGSSIDPTITQTETSTPTITLQPTDAAIAAIEPTLTPSEIPSLEPTPIEDPTSYSLLIAKGGNKGEDSLYIVNLTAEAFPLAALLIRDDDDDDAINGTEWGIDVLQSGACVTIWKDKGDPDAPDVTCEEVGERLETWGKTNLLEGYIRHLLQRRASWNL